MKYTQKCSLNNKKMCDSLFKNKIKHDKIIFSLLVISSKVLIFSVNHWNHNELFVWILSMFGKRERSSKNKLK